MEPADRNLPPAIAADVDQDADEPGLFVRRAVRHRFGRPGRTEEGLLDEVSRILGTPRQPARQPEEPWLMGVEQGPQTHGGIVLRTFRRRGEQQCLTRHIQTGGLRPAGPPIAVACRGPIPRAASGGARLRAPG